MEIPDFKTLIEKELDSGKYEFPIEKRDDIIQGAFDDLERMVSSCVRYAVTYLDMNFGVLEVGWVIQINDRVYVVKEVSENATIQNIADNSDRYQISKSAQVLVISKIPLIF